MIERSDKKKNDIKVTKEVIKEPLQSQREIAKKAWVGLWTANRVMKELEQNWTESNILDKILEMDDKIIALSNGMTLEMIEEKINQKEKLTVQDHKVISDIANNSTKRKAIFWDTWWDKNYNFIIS